MTWVTDPAWLLINTLCAYRLTRLWVHDTLPPLPRLRAWVEARAWKRHTTKTGDDTGTVPFYGQPPAVYLVSCAWCAGFWIAAATTAAATLTPTPIWAWIAVPLAISAVVGILDHATN